MNNYVNEALRLVHAGSGGRAPVNWFVTWLACLCRPAAAAAAINNGDDGSPSQTTTAR